MKIWISLLLIFITACKFDDFIIKQPQFSGSKIVFYNHTNSECMICHENKRPIANIPHGDNQDCGKCHSPALNGQNQRSWLNFKTYSHQPTPQSCKTCHENKRPVTHQLNPSIVGMNNADCNNYHRSVNNWFNTTVFNHEEMKPIECKTCHDGSKPQITHPSAKGSYAMIDCSHCHNYLPTPKTWKTITFNYNNHLPAPSTCNECHKNVNNSLPASQSHSQGSRSNNDCFNCHVYDNVNLWKKYSKFNHSMLEVQERCDSCHGQENLLTKKPGNHISTGMDCGACHVIGGWVPASFKHSNSDSNCISCHNGVIASNKPNSHTLSGQCSSCHTQSSWALTYKESYIHLNSIIPVNNGRAHPSGSDCSKCHSSVTDSVKWVYTSITSGTTINPINTCAGCHLREYNNEHGILTTTNNANCLSCHSSYSW